MAYRGPQQVVLGNFKTRHVSYLPCAEEGFKDHVRSEIVETSMRAHNLYLKASLLPETNLVRIILFDEAVQIRLDERARWLALEPPDQDGAWKADLAIATYFCQKNEMVAAYDMLMSVRTGAPKNWLVYKVATKNLTQMFLQARSQLSVQCFYGIGSCCWFPDAVLHRSIELERPPEIFKPTFFLQVTPRKFPAKLQPEPISFSVYANTCIFSEVPSQQQFARLRAFWVWVESL